MVDEIFLGIKILNRLNFNDPLVLVMYGFFYLTSRLSLITLVCVQTLACKCGFKVVETFEHAFYRQVQKYTEEISLQPFCLDRVSAWRRISIPF